MRVDKRKKHAKLTRAADGSMKVVMVPDGHKDYISKITGKEIEPESTTPLPKSMPKELTINFKFPKLPTGSLKKIPNKLKIPKKLLALGVLIVTVIIILAIGIKFFNNTDGTNTEGKKAAAKPDYHTIVPNGTVENTTSKGVKYDASKKVASYTDSINGINITVSLQPLPDSFKDNVADNVKKIAEQFSANEKLGVKDGSAYIGTSAKGPQSLVGQKNSLLVFMKSEAKIDNAEWVKYFDSLQ